MFVETSPLNWATANMLHDFWQQRTKIGKICWQIWLSSRHMPCLVETLKSQVSNPKIVLCAGMGGQFSIWHVILSKGTQSMTMSLTSICHQHMLNKHGMFSWKPESICVTPALQCRYGESVPTWRMLPDSSTESLSKLLRFDCQQHMLKRAMSVCGPQDWTLHTQFCKP